MHYLISSFLVPNPTTESLYCVKKVGKRLTVLEAAIENHEGPEYNSLCEKIELGFLRREKIDMATFQSTKLDMNEKKGFG